MNKKIIDKKLTVTEQKGSTLKQIFHFADQLALKAQKNDKSAEQVLKSAYEAWYQTT